MVVCIAAIIFEAQIKQILLFQNDINHVLIHHVSLYVVILKKKLTHALKAKQNLTEHKISYFNLIAADVSFHDQTDSSHLK